MNKVEKSVLTFIVLFLNTSNLFADISNRGRLDSDGTSDDLGLSLMGIGAIIIGGFIAYFFIRDGFENGFKDKESNKIGCGAIIVAIVGLLVLVAMCSH